MYFQQQEPIKVQIWWNFTWAVKSLIFPTLMGYFCSNHIEFQLKSTERLSLILLKSSAKFKEKLACGFKYGISNLVNFNPTIQNTENFTSMGYFCPKYIRFQLKKFRGFIFHDTGQWCQIWINPGPKVSKMAWGIGWTFIRALKSLKNCTLMGSFCPKYIACFS